MSKYYDGMPLEFQRACERAGVPPKAFEGHHEECSFGGFGCLFWIAHPDCKAFHFRVHIHNADVSCPND